MKTYSVDVPFCGRLVMEVLADSAEQAIEIAINEASLDDVEEWGAHEHICEGNVFYGCCNDAEAVLVDDEATAS